MNILVLIDDYLPDSIKVAAKMMHELCTFLVKKGHMIYVITPYKRTQSFKLDGVYVKQFRSGRIKNVNWFIRALNESLLSIRAWISFRSFFKKNPCDFIIYYSPSIFWGLLVKRLKRLWSVKSYLILRDFFPQWVIDNGIISESSFAAKYFKIFEKINYKNADRIGVQSEKNLLWFNCKYKKYQNCSEVLYNWAEKKNKMYMYGFRKKWKLENKILYFYGGNIGHAQDMMNIIKLIIKFKKYKKVHFILLGDGDELSLVKNQIKLNNLTNTLLLPPVDQIEYKCILSEIDVGMISLNYKHTTHNFPGKLLGYMVEEKPILGSVNPGNDVINIINNSKSGYISVNGDDDLFFNNAVKLLNSNVRFQLGKNANKLLVKIFSVENAAKKILKT